MASDLSVARRALQAVLAQPVDTDLDDDAPTPCEQIESMIKDLGWLSVLAVLLDELATSSEAHVWRTVCEVLWGAALDKRAMNEDQVIAHLCYRYPMAEAGEDNLAWSIISKLKGKSYLSSYDPRGDPGVAAQLRILEARA